MITTEFIGNLVKAHREVLKERLRKLPEMPIREDYPSDDRLFRLFPTRERLDQRIMEATAELEHCDKLLADWAILGPKQS